MRRHVAAGILLLCIIGFIPFLIVNLVYCPRYSLRDTWFVCRVIGWSALSVITGKDHLRANTCIRLE